MISHHTIILISSILCGLFLHNTAWRLPRARLPRSSTSLQHSVAQSYYDEYWKRLIQRKEMEVDHLLRIHNTPEDPLQMRLTYMASEGQFNITHALRRPDIGTDQLHSMNVMVDVKRRSPTLPRQQEIIQYDDCATFCELLANIEIDAFLVNLDESDYGGALGDLKQTSLRMKQWRPEKPPACIAKDTFVHPLQLAQAVHNGASGILLNAAVAGANLETMLDSCTIMGVEAMVEVHTMAELEYALEKGATIFLVNMWDRMTGKYFKDQAKAMASMIPMTSVAAVCGNIHTMDQVEELGFLGYDAVVLGRGLLEIPDLKDFVKKTHEYVGPSRKMGLGMKTTSWAAAAYTAGY